MAYQFDNRIVSVDIEIGDTIKTYSSPFTLTAYGMKYANDLQSEADIIIENRDRETRDNILTQSYGTSVIYTGNIVTALLSQPPDIGLSMKCLTGNYIKGSMITRTQAGNVSLEVVAKSIADSLGVALKFEASNINIPNASYNGEALGQITTLNQYGNINAFIDNGFLIVKDGPVGLTGEVTVVNKNTGMIGIPTFTEQGLRVKFLIDPKTKLGGYLRCFKLNLSHCKRSLYYL